MKKSNGVADDGASREEVLVLMMGGGDISGRLPGQGWKVEGLGYKTNPVYRHFALKLPGFDLGALLRVERT